MSEKEKAWGCYGELQGHNDKQYVKQNRREQLPSSMLTPIVL
jgi:hypothetical protein